MARCATLSSKEGRNAQPALAAIRFGNIVPTDWWRLVTARFESVYQTEQVFLQLHFILLRRLTINSHRAIFARAFIGIVHPLVVNVMV